LQKWVDENKLRAAMEGRKQAGTQKKDTPFVERNNPFCEMIWLQIFRD